MNTLTNAQRGDFYRCVVPHYGLDTSLVYRDNDIARYLREYDTEMASPVDNAARVLELEDALGKERASLDTLIQTLAPLAPKIEVRYALGTVDGCEGNGICGGAFEWAQTYADSGETASVMFKQFIDGEEVDTFEIDGDDWREIDNCNYVDEVLKFVRGGATLAEAVQACVECRYPDNWNDGNDRLVELLDVLRPFLD